MAKRPPKKPTDEFGQIKADPYGPVVKVVEQLPSTKVGQEEEVGKRFAAALARETGRAWSIRLLDEVGHDFMLIDGETEVEVQAVEIAAKRDFLTRIPPEAWKQKRHAFSSVVVFDPDDVWGVDLVKRRRIVWEKVALKLSKSYAKPARPLWLLVWTVFTGLPTTAANGTMPSKVVSYARRELQSRSALPFDEIWMWTARDEVVRVWPSEAPVEDDLDIIVDERTPANPGMYIPATAMTLVSSVVRPKPKDKNSSK